MSCLFVVQPVCSTHLILLSLSLSSAKVEEAARQRQLEAVDMFLETARAHLKTLGTGTSDGDKQQREQEASSEPAD